MPASLPSISAICIDSVRVSYISGSQNALFCVHCGHGFSSGMHLAHASPLCATEYPHPTRSDSALFRYAKERPSVRALMGMPLLSIFPRSPSRFCKNQATLPHKQRKCDLCHLVAFQEAFYVCVCLVHLSCIPSVSELQARGPRCSPRSSPRLASIARSRDRSEPACTRPRILVDHHCWHHHQATSTSWTKATYRIS